MIFLDENDPMAKAYEHMTIFPCAAGTFYPDDADELRRCVADMLSHASSNQPIPKAIIAPHAGYIYSGPVAASAYACLAKAKGRIQRVVLLAPSHRAFIDGAATTTASAYQTPLGTIPIENPTHLRTADEAFYHEHAIEVHLPFLQLTLETFSLVPILIGEASPLQVADTIENLFGGPETLLIVSSDLSHYHPYDIAHQMDTKTAQSIVSLHPDDLGPNDACGVLAIQGLLIVAAKKKMQGKQLDLRTSAEESGDRQSVVGYGAFHFTV